VHEHVLYAVLQRDARARAPHAAPRQRHRDDPRPLLESNVPYVPPVLLHGGAYPRLEEFLDHRHDLVVVVEYRRVGDDRRVPQRGLSGRVEVHDGTEDGCLEVLPLGLGEFRHGEEVVPEVDRLDAGIEVEEGLGEGGPRYQDVILTDEVDPIGVLFPDVVFVVDVSRLDLAEAQVGRVDAAPV